MTDEEAEALKQSTGDMFMLTDAQVVALLDKGGAYVEQAATLEVSEGRLWSYGGRRHDGETPREYLEYHLTFEVPECDATLSQWARVLIVGTHPSGARLEIRGSGMVGYDQRGQPQGHFYKPPKIRVIQGETAAEKLKREAILHGAMRAINEGVAGLTH